MRRRRHAKFDFGQAQKQFGENEIERKDTLHTILAMDRYSKNELITEPMSPRTQELCKNKFEKCAYYASKDMCRDLSRMNFMMSNCPLACQMCDVVEDFERCVGRRSTEVAPLFIGSNDESSNDGQRKMTIDEFFKAGRDEVKWYGQGMANEMDLAFIVQPLESNNFDDPWVVKVESFLNEKECKDLIGSEESDAVIIQTILERISSTFQLPRTHFSPFQINRLDASTVQITGGMQHDYSIHDVWKPAGPRVLSFYLSLSNVEEGGQLGFPELDWLLIEPKLGQLLMWSNVVSTNPEKDDKRMIREELPVTKGEKYSAHVSVHLFDWEDANERKCF